MYTPLSFAAIVDSSKCRLSFQRENIGFSLNWLFKVARELGLEGEKGGGFLVHREKHEVVSDRQDRLRGNQLWEQPSREQWLITRRGSTPDDATASRPQNHTHWCGGRPTANVALLSDGVVHIWKYTSQLGRKYYTLLSNLEVEKAVFRKYLQYTKLKLLKYFLHIRLLWWVDAYKWFRFLGIVDNDHKTKS